MRNDRQHSEIDRIRYWLRWSLFFLMVQLAWGSSIHHGQRMVEEVFAETDKAEIILLSLPAEQITGNPQPALSPDQPFMKDSAARYPPETGMDSGVEKCQGLPEIIKEDAPPDPKEPSANRLQAANASALYRPQSHTHSLFHSLISKAANRHGLDPALIKAMIMVESAFNPKAVSIKGAKGLMQLMPETAKDLGVKNIFDPEENIFGGVRYFKELITMFDGDIKLALAAYNAGMKWVKHYKGIPPFSVTRSYVKKVIEYRQHYKEKMEEDAGMQNERQI